jgi:hypothetical protein
VQHSASLEDSDGLMKQLSSGISAVEGLLSTVDDEIATSVTAAAAAGFGFQRSLSIGFDGSQSLQRQLSRAPSAKSHG